MPFGCVWFKSFYSILRVYGWLSISADVCVCECECECVVLQVIVGFSGTPELFIDLLTCASVVCMCMFERARK